MAWQTDYCIMKERMSILRGRKSVPRMNSSEREMERRHGGNDNHRDSNNNNYSGRIPVMDGTRETGVISPTDLPILVLSSPGVPLRATPIQFALLVDVDTKESVVELQADWKPGASGRVFAITEGQAANTS
nr:hypothetical protein [Tanacetum cinerariifolium]